MAAFANVEKGRMLFEPNLKANLDDAGPCL